MEASPHIEKNVAQVTLTSVRCKAEETLAGWIRMANNILGEMEETPTCIVVGDVSFEDSLENRQLFTHHSNFTHSK